MLFVILESLKRGEVAPHSPTPYKALICCGFRVEPCIFAILTLHFVVSVVFLGLCCLVAYDFGHFREDQLFSTWDKVGLGVAVVAVVYLVTSLLLYHATKQRDARLYRGCACALWALSVAALLFILFSPHAHWNPGHRYFFMFKCLVGVGWVQLMVGLTRSDIFLKSAEARDELNKECEVSA